jgi:hypothetical protein
VLDVEVTAADALVVHVRDHGGVLWVRADRHRCCTGALTTLHAATDTPRDAHAYEQVPSDLAIDVRYLGGPRRPDRLVLEMRGRRRAKPAAYWDGCAIAL